ncbi:MAG: hypothetical protein H7832_10615 [Magnetococcus sp. DMHC-6]
MPIKSIDIDHFAPSVKNLLDDIHRLIGPIYLVGGGLRNALHGKFDTNEMDLLVPEALAECRRKLLEGGIASVEMGNRLNSLTIRLKQDQLPRIIHLSTFRHRPAYPITVEEDLLHRDITQNAMAWPWPNGPLIDPFLGYQDLLDNYIRLVNGVDTILEDPIRALRFFRFTMQFQGIPNSSDLNLCMESSLGSVMQKLIRAELDRILSLPLTENTTKNHLITLFNSHLGSQILPEVANLKLTKKASKQGENDLEHTLRLVLAIKPPTEEEDISITDLRWAALLHLLDCEENFSEPTNQKKSSRSGLIIEDKMQVSADILDRLDFINRRKRDILNLIYYLNKIPTTPTDRVLRRLFEMQIPLEGLFRLLAAKLEIKAHLKNSERDKKCQECHRTLQRCQNMRLAQKRLHPVDLALNGGDILDMVRQPSGPWLGQLLQKLIDWVTQDPSRNRRDHLERRVLEWISKNDLTAQSYK